MLAFSILLAATACMGVGFGFTVPALNTFAAGFFPTGVDKAVLGLNALLGLGTALAPVFIAIFVGLGIWWGLPLLVSGLLIGLLLFSLRLPLNQGAQQRAAEAAIGTAPLPARFCVFATFGAALRHLRNNEWQLGISLYDADPRASTTVASLALTVFWSAVTADFAAIERWFPENRTYRVLPLVVAAALVIVAFIPKGRSVLGILTFGLAGLGCSALLPLTISFGQKELTSIAASVAGGMIAFYQIGYGIGAFGVGPLQSWVGLDLNAIYGATALVALVMSALSFVVVKRQNARALSGRTNQHETSLTSEYLPQRRKGRKVRNEMAYHEGHEDHEVKRNVGVTISDLRALRAFVVNTHAHMKPGQLQMQRRKHYESER